MELGLSHLLALIGVSRMNSQHAAEQHLFVAMEAKNFVLLILHTVSLFSENTK